MNKSFVVLFFLLACSPVSPASVPQNTGPRALSDLVLPSNSPTERPKEEVQEETDQENQQISSELTLEPSAEPEPGLEQASPVQASPLQIDKTVYDPFETFEVHFSIAPGLNLDESAWVGIIPAEIPHGNENDNDFFDLAYATLAGNAEGTLVFEAPDLGGAYELRLFSSDDDGEELFTLPFTVDAPIRPVSGNQIRTNKMIYRPGETILAEVSIKAEDKADETAWVGIIPTEVPHGSEEVNDASNLGYRYMGPYLAGKMQMKAPEQAGIYDLRLHSSDTQGQELVFVTFLVKD